MVDNSVSSFAYEDCRLYALLTVYFDILFFKPDRIWY